LRATVQRAAVLEVLVEAAGSGEHLPAAEVARRARTRLDGRSGPIPASISTQAIYDCLDALVAAHLARRIRPAGAAGAVYEARTANHHHVVCRGCGATSDVDCLVGASPCLAPGPGVPAGFVLDEAEVTFWGWCASCQPPTTPPIPSQEEIR
jgi:Fur family ferric uptake transcriptional regulator